MIGGVLVIIALLVIRLSADDVPLPTEIALPPGITAEAVTFGSDWIAIVSQEDSILIFDRSSGELRQTIQITR